MDLDGGCEQLESLDTLKVFISSATRPRPTRFSPPTPDSVRLEADITRNSFPERQRGRGSEREKEEIKGRHIKYKFTRPLAKVGHFH